jgi:hypothetical protein
MLIAAERNYSTMQKELLAVVYGTQIHRCFLYGRKFKVVTTALKWLVKVKNHHCARLIRWVLKLAEYDFNIEHKAGKKHVNADCLSCHITSITTAGDRKPHDDKLSNVLTRETVFAVQQHDVYCRELISKVRSGNGSEYLISKDGLLYVGPDLDHAKLVVPEKLTQRIIDTHHDKVFAGHQGVKQPRYLVKLNYFWSSMNQDIENYVKQCDSCAKFKASHSTVVTVTRDYSYTATAKYH